MNDAKEVKIPCVLLVVGLVIYLAFGLVSGGPTGAAMVLLANAIELAVLVPLGIAACFIVAAILSTSFGSIGTASLKLAAIMVFPHFHTALPCVADWADFLISHCDSTVLVPDRRPL
jgi:hypothetical protein